VRERTTDIMEKISNNEKWKKKKKKRYCLKRRKQKDDQKMHTKYIMKSAKVQKYLIKQEVTIKRSI